MFLNWMLMLLLLLLLKFGDEGICDKDDRGGQLTHFVGGFLSFIYDFHITEIFVLVRNHDLHINMIFSTSSISS